ncbi:hypothetical protein CB1_001451001 [Camelus ferus]|nr:hypothetical protein CB1_001451001 [Camelus ferus]
MRIPVLRFFPQSCCRYWRSLLLSLLLHCVLAGCDTWGLQQGAGAGPLKLLHSHSECRVRTLPLMRPASAFLPESLWPELQSSASLGAALFLLYRSVVDASLGCDLRPSEHVTDGVIGPVFLSSISRGLVFALGADDIHWDWF